MSVCLNERQASRACGNSEPSIGSCVSLGESPPSVQKPCFDGGSDPSQRMSESHVTSAHRLRILPSREREREYAFAYVAKLAT